MGRAPCCDKDNVKKGPWSPEEDSKLKAYIQQNGTGGNWIALPQKVGLKRCGKSCRLRWLNYLRPNIKHGGFSEEEDHIIVSLYGTIGSRWSIIAAHLPGRTDNDIKNYWNTKLKKKLFGKRKDQHGRRLAATAAKQAEMFGIKRYASSEASPRTSVYGTQPRAVIDHNMNMNINWPYAHFSPGIAPQLYEQTTLAELPTITDTNPSTQPPRFHLNFQQPFDQEVFEADNNTSFRKLLERLESNLTDRSNNMNLVSICQMQVPNSISMNNNASQIPNSSLEYETAKFHNPAYLQTPSVLDASFPPSDISLVFSPSTVTCGSPQGSHQSACLNTFNDEAYILSMDWNDLLNCTNNNSSSLALPQREADS
ncbi:hypothetical protein SUGI_0898980 [Cryptomeria japonica]|uniref:transcription factor MYB87 n=1 Tax=Cryptomeria japonica TaxID=3369 RepID=UPI002414A956|nr:transcription factor MYB87 [Cryptomeria japonica]GLJ43291.1 hypothetical protein SUGI_0898980 [Cryptomeria japonica]